MQEQYNAVKAVVVFSGKILVLKQSVGIHSFWDYPGGRIKMGEDFRSALHREVSEETGLKVKILKELGECFFYRIVDGKKVVCKTFLCSAETSAVDISKNKGTEKISEHKWIGKNELLSPEYVFSHDSMKKIIESL